MELIDATRQDYAPPSRLHLLPWLTEPARTFLEGFLATLPRAVLEFGAGGSTVWLSHRCRVTTVESERSWFDAIAPYVVSTHWTPIFHPRPYAGALRHVTDAPFDLVLVDGRDRVDCVQSAVRLLRPGGVLMLDNAERGHYRQIHNEFCKDWNTCIGAQRRPDGSGFTYEGWLTQWWWKP